MRGVNLERVVRGERGVVLIAVTVLVAVIGSLAGLATLQRRQGAALEAAFIARYAIEGLRLSMQKPALADFAAGKPFPRTYRIDDLEALVSVDREEQRINLNSVSPEKLADDLSRAEIAEEIVSQLVQGLERLRRDKKQLSSLIDPVRYGLVDPYRYWIEPGLYRLFTVYSPEALRVEMTLTYRGKTYRFLSILAPDHTPLFEFRF